MKLVFAGTLALLVLASCAARGPSPQLLADAARADTLVHEGCYVCLRDAIAIFERLALPPQPAPRALERAFDAALLLHVREKELGLPSEQSWARAQQLAARVAVPGPPATRDRSPTGTSAGRALPAVVITPAAMLEAADLINGDFTGLDPPTRQLRVRRFGSASPSVPSGAPARRALDAAINTSVVAAYLSLAIDCEDPSLRAKIAKEAILTRHGSPALLKFRTGICGTPSRDLTALREQQPQWTDAFYFEGRREMIGLEIDLEKATARYASAHEAFPASPAITLALAHAQQSMADFEPALASFDLVIAATPTHRDALLGRLTTLSYMMRHPDAVATATRLIELGTWHVGDAYYWRAWNQYYLEAIEQAWQDVETARKLLMNTNVYMLAGLTEYARKQVDTAIQRFDRAYELDSANCDAVWFAALAHVDKQDWPSATPKFARGMSCYTAAAAEARRQLAAIAASNASEMLKERRAAKERKMLDTSEHRAAQSAFNAAQGFLRQGNKTMALNHVDVAAAHPLLKEKAEELRKMIVSCATCG